MWIVRLALRRPYTFTVMAIMLLVMGTISFQRMPKDIFPGINIPVVSVIWSYQGLPAEEIERRIVTISERAMTTTVNDIEHIESQSMNGVTVIRVFFQPNAKIDAAVSQVTAINQTILRVLPPGATPPLILRYDASSVPILQIALSSETLSEQQLYDLGLNFVRRGLLGVQGASVPLPYGGKQRQVMVDLDLQQLQAKGISPSDVSAAVNAQNVILPTGSVKIGETEFTVMLNSSPEKLEQLNNLPIKTINGAMVYIRDVANVRDGFAVQQNVVVANGGKAALLSVLKSGNASTVDVVERVRKTLPVVAQTVPKELEMTPMFDQSLFVLASLDGVQHEALIAAALTAAMILLFLGSWRSTLVVATSIPLSICCSIIGLYALGYTINIMTLGGLALAVGILVDDATVEIENIHRNLAMGKPLVKAILDGAQQIAVPAFVATTCICIVFIPIFLLQGVAYYLFTPLALAVVIAMMSSYFLSRTVVPTMVHFLLPGEKHDHQLEGDDDWDDEKKPEVKKEAPRQENGRGNGQAPAERPAAAHHNGHAAKTESRPAPEKDGAPAAARDEAPRKAAGYVSDKGGTAFNYLHHTFLAGFNAVRGRYVKVLRAALKHRAITLGLTVGFVLLSLASLVPFLGRDFFPQVDAGQFRLHVRAPAGTRIEETQALFARVHEVIKEVIPADELDLIIDNIGLPVGGINLAFSDSATVSAADGEILVSLKKEKHGPTWDYVKTLREKLPQRFPEVVFFTQPSDIVGQILNFGLPAPIDVQINGPAENAAENFAIAKQIRDDIAKIRGAVDVHVHQVLDVPTLFLNVDRTKADLMGLTQREIGSDVLIALSSSSQTAPNYWLNPKNGVNYTVATQAPPIQLDSIDSLMNMPIGGTQSLEGSAALQPEGVHSEPQLLSNLATLSRIVTPAVVNHYDIKPSLDVLSNVQGRDLGGVSDDVRKVIAKWVPQPTWLQAQATSWGIESFVRGQAKYWGFEDKLKNSGWFEVEKSKLPRGSVIVLRGQVISMESAYTGLGYGLLGAIALIYFLLVVNFQSWLDPFIIIMALPGALAGIAWGLFLTGTTLSVPALMGAIMCVGVATANSILVVSFANEQRRLGKDSTQAALAAGATRLRPVIMTALAMIIGMLPMSLGLGEGGEQNAPLGRAVIGGLALATIATLIFVPTVYSWMRTKTPGLDLDPLLRDPGDDESTEGEAVTAHRDGDGDDREPEHAGADGPSSRRERNHS